MKMRITVPEIAEALGVSTSTVYGMLHTGQIPHVRAGALYIVSRVAFERWWSTLGMDVDGHSQKV
jgi:excisionase family DNA binding protein